MDSPPSKVDQRGVADPAAVPVSSLAKKVPQPKKTGNVATDVELALRRQSFVNLISLGEAYPDHCMPVLTFFQDRVRKSYAAVGDEEEFFAKATATSEMISQREPYDFRR